eukprot:m.30447 g.30447  ORF g.30447 m.30447 type:complete len:719 (-) comp16287_c0_seq1:149-2305(-)
MANSNRVGVSMAICAVLWSNNVGATRGGLATAANCSAINPYIIAASSIPQKDGVFQSPTCLDFGGLNELATGPFAIADNYPMPYFVTSPCHNVTDAETNCTSFIDGDSLGAPAYAYSLSKCYALGHNSQMSITLLDQENPSGGVVVKMEGGVGGRAMQYHFLCDPTASNTTGPWKAMEGGIDGYTFLWNTSSVCNPRVLPMGSPGCVTPIIPKPSPELLAFQEMEVGALICYNMATMVGSQGCSAHSVPPASDFNNKPLDQVNTDQWCQAISSFGGKYATMVVKHMCGFLIWSSTATSGNFTYEYQVPKGVDLIKKFADSCAKVDVKLGIYYSVVANSYLNVKDGVVQPASTVTAGQVAITQAQYVDIVEQHLNELWSNYGDLAEIWFDGGFNIPGMQEKLLTLYNTKQPNAPVFNGCGLTKNAVAWIGTESGHAPYPVWNTQTGCPSGAGSVDGTSYVPKEVDLTLQNSDTWFYEEGRGYRSLSEMVGIYHDSVGHGGNMLLNLAPPPNSTIPDVAMDTYAALGNFISECYGHGAVPATSVLANSSGCVNCTTITLTFKTPTTFDRFVAKEELSGGQLVDSFEIVADGKSVFNGSAIGRSLIYLFPVNITATTVVLNVLDAKAPPSFRLFAIPNPSSCAVSSGPGGCDLIPNTRYLGPSFQTTTVPSVADCCAACAKVPKCAFFTASIQGVVQSCSLMAAQQGSETATGVISGSPKN